MLSSRNKRVTICLEDPNVVFRRNHRDDQPYNFGGSIQLITDAPTTVKGVSITIQAFRKVSWVTNTLQASWVRQKDLAFCKDLNLFPGTGIDPADAKYGSGCHSWPFSFILEANMPETVDSLPFSYIRYYLTAEIRTGRWSKPLRAVQSIRVIKTPSLWAEDTNFLEQNADIWPDKISYRISLSHVYHTLFKQMTVDFLLIPLKEGITIGDIKLELMETILLIATKDGRPWRVDKSSKVIASTVTSLPPQYKGGVDSLQDLEMPEESQRFPVNLDLPQGLNLRLRSVADDKIKVRYILKVSVELMNPEGHVSKLTTTLHPSFYASIPGESSEMVLEETRAPPLYGDHIFDKLCDGDPVTELPDYEDA